MRLNYRGTSLITGVLRLIVSVSIAGVGLYISILWILRDFPDVSVIRESAFSDIFLDIIIPIILLVLSYGAARDSLLDFFDVLKRRKRDKK